MKKIASIFVLLAAALGLMMATDESFPEADFTFIMPQDIFTLDPQAMSYNQDLRMSYALYETLVRWDNESASFDIIPAAAEGWEVSEDGTVYTFFLRPEAKWSDGAPVTSEDFAYAWQRAMLPDSAADYSGLFFCIRGAEDYFEWRMAQLEAYAERPVSERDDDAAIALRAESNARFRDTVGVRPVSDHVLEVELIRPTAYFLDLCAFGPFSPVPRHVVDEFVTIDRESGRLQQDQTWTKPWNHEGNGPYMVTQWQFKRGMFLERNPYYWDQDAIVSDTIRTKPIADGNTSILAYNTGAADWHSDATVDYIADMLEEKAKGERADVHALSTFGTYFWSFNCMPRLADGRSNPFHDPRVRRAFAMCIDKKAIVDKVKRSGEKVAHVLIPPASIGGFRSPEGVRFDPGAAVSLLAEAGWSDRDGDGVPENASGEPFPEVEMLCSTGSYHEKVAMAMGRMLRETLGVQMKIDAKESKIYKDDLKKKDYMMARGGWFGDYGDPTTFLDLHRTGDGNNDRGYSDSVFDGLLDQAAAEADPEARLRILEEAEALTMNETLPVLPVWHYNYYYMFEPARKDGAVVFDQSDLPTETYETVVTDGVIGVSYHPRLIQYLWKLGVVDEPTEVRVTPMGVFAK